MPKRGARRLELHHVAVPEVELPGVRHGDGQRIPPGGLGDGVRKFLEPAAVGVAAVMDLGAGAKQQFEGEVLGREGTAGCLIYGGALEGGRGRSLGVLLHHPVMQGDLEETLEGHNTA